MIIDVSIGDEEPRRYQVRRDGERIVVRRMEADEGSSGNGGNPGAGVAETVIDWRRPQAGIYSLLVDNASFEVFVEEEPEHLAVHLATETFRVRAANVRRHRATRGAAVAADGVARITAPIPGRVARILVAVGDAVKRGDGIVVLEAMKMENELRAPRDGTVVAVDVEEGQGVEGGTVLASIE